jgi:beta/gamma crystallin
MADAGNVLPEVILFEHENFRGAHRHIFQDEEDLAKTARGSAASSEPEGGKFDKATSSVIVKGRHWTFFVEEGFKGTKKKTLKPGRYPKASDLRPIENDKIISVRLATDAEVAAL